MASTLLTVGSRSSRCGPAIDTPSGKLARLDSLGYSVSVDESGKSVAAKDAVDVWRVDQSRACSRHPDYRAHPSAWDGVRQPLEQVHCTASARHARI